MKDFLYKITRSSADPEKLSLTVRGVLIGIVPLLYVILNANGVSITQSELVDLATEVAAVTFGGYSLLLTVVGVARKVYYYFN